MINLRTALSSVALAIAFAGGANAAAIIDNGTVQLGVDSFGQLNIPGGTPSAVDGETIVGLRFLPTGNEGTSHGCLCEGWGVGIADAGGAALASGSANNSVGDTFTGLNVSNLDLVSFADDGTSATSVVELSSGELRITHKFAPAAETPNLYRVTVDIENISGADIADLRYTRSFDWDVEPSTFDEIVTIKGADATASVLFANDNGFSSSNPFGGRSEIVAGATGDFTDLGPADHGALFDFGFGGLAAGEIFSFDIFFGGAATEVAADAAIAAVSAEVVSFGQAAFDPDGLGLTDDFGNPSNTFIFGFSGVGGSILVPVPVPAPLALILVGLIGVGVARRRA